MEFQYSRRLKYGRKGRVNYFRYKGRKVKTFITPDGRTLQILKIPKTLEPEFSDVEKVIPYDSRLKVIKKKEQPKPAPPPPQEKKEEKPKPQPKPQPKKQPQQKPQPKPKPQPQPQPRPEEKLGEPRELTEAERRKAMKVPVPDKGPIPAPYIDWENIPESCIVPPGSVVYYDHPARGAPKGMLQALRECFRTNRRYQDIKPTNVLIIGPPGTGKSILVRKFAEETGLPYWHVMGRQGITAEELLGREVLVPEKGGTRSVWVEGIIPKAVRAGGILHIDEANVIDPAVLMRLDELLDHKRRLSLEDITGKKGHIIKAHPDLFIVFTMNPPNYEGVNPLPNPILNRVVTFELDFPPLKDELRIVATQLRQAGFKPSEFTVDKKGVPKGKYADEIIDFTKVVDSLRRNRDLQFHPSIRNTIDFAMALKQGLSFKDAFYRTIGNLYIGYAGEPEYEQAMEEALQAVNRL
jgi:MoxR-like ATPase